MQVWSDNWTLPSTSQVKITLSVQPSGLTAVFNSPECAAGFGTATCTLAAAPGTPEAPTNLEADVPVKASANTVDSATLTATVASPAGATLSAPLYATGAVQVTAAASASSSASASASGSGQSSSPSSGSSSSTGPLAPLGPLGDGTTNSLGIGPIPELNNESSSLIGAGNAASLFPQINPAASPSPVPGVGAGSGSSKGKADGSPTVSLLPLGMPVVTAQVVGLIALAVAFLLALTRISLRRRPRGR